MSAWKQLVHDASLPALVAGCIATLISFAGPLVLVFQAAQGMPHALLESWVWTISIGSGVLGIVLSLRYRVPVVVAWSAPGSALLITLLPTVSFPEAVGAYLVASVATFVIGVSGTFDKIVSRLPAGISAAMLAGILFGFAAKMFVVLPAQPLLVGAMFAAFFAGRRWFPRYAVVGVLAVGALVAVLGGKLTGHAPSLQFTVPAWTTPRIGWQAVVNLSLPLMVVALTGQWVPGMAVLRNGGYTRPSAGPLIAWSAAVSAVLAPFGCHGLNLAAITAAICTGHDAHPDPDRRYVAGVAGGVLYLVLGCIAATVLSLFAMLPKELIAALAGLALFPTIANALAASMSDVKDRDAALVTFIVSASGMSLFGLGAAFWGLLFGLAAHALLRWKVSRRATMELSSAGETKT
ncbi:benzoate/H(+) symporter BenE family transporter [Paraburkholderia caballeronis]|uniref:benzoate/H(+) symporter BenE family transporter n=1 Tax=Paraburkholderia caballeronis TaxID=416943 RepID=UPI001064AF78|nr:benzoate/H(+) symporter BenE family transporter [Paraburkholderia caballeronis]TDV11738.1 benzoate membrane transport protein [Paraburkholderia caballeronis]TDV14819.1 benzoate membrane transport protein [Paraburkholderia caballeronis]TDV23939.1 benzoate membrane transport protein [Paraburkholderia caballeronis]